jgi:hypothetical protein
MNQENYHLKEYVSLHTEAERYVRELFTLEQFTVAGTLAVYAWLLTDQNGQSERIIWYLPLMFGVFAALRSAALGWQLYHISEYLHRLERIFITSEKDASSQTGWENYWREKNGAKMIFWTTVVFWIIIFSVQVMAPHFYEPQPAKLHPPSVSIPLSTPTA